MTVPNNPAPLDVAAAETTNGENIDALLRRYCDAAVEAGRIEAADSNTDNGSPADRAWELVAKLRTEIGLRIRALEDAAQPPRPAALEVAADETATAGDDVPQRDPKLWELVERYGAACMWQGCGSSRATDALAALADYVDAQPPRPAAVAEADVRKRIKSAIRMYGVCAGNVVAARRRGGDGAEDERFANEYLATAMRLVDQALAAPAPRDPARDAAGEDA